MLKIKRSCKAIRTPIGLNILPLRSLRPSSSASHQRPAQQKRLVASWYHSHCIWCRKTVQVVSNNVYNHLSFRHKFIDINRQVVWIPPRWTCPRRWLSPSPLTTAGLVDTFYEEDFFLHSFCTFYRPSTASVYNILSFLIPTEGARPLLGLVTVTASRIAEYIF